MFSLVRAADAVDIRARTAEGVVNCILLVTRDSKPVLYLDVLFNFFISGTE